MSRKRIPRNPPMSASSMLARNSSSGRLFAAASPMSLPASLCGCRRFSGASWSRSRMWSTIYLRSSCCLGFSSTSISAPLASPTFAYRVARHRLNGSGLATGDEIEVEKNPKQHDERRYIVDHIRDRDQDAPENLRQPHNDAGNDIGDAAANNLPELEFLASIEEADIGGFRGIRFRDIFLHALHPARVSGSPAHHAKPVQRLQSEEDHEAQAEPGKQEAGRRAPAAQRSEEAEDPRQIDSEARQQSQEEEDPDHPVQKARVHGMAQQFAGIDDGAPETINHVGAMYEAIGRSRHLVLLSRWRRWRVNSHYRRSRLLAPWTLENIMHDHADEAQHRAEQSNRFEDVLPNCEA